MSLMTPEVFHAQEASHAALQQQESSISPSTVIEAAYRHRRLWLGLFTTLLVLTIIVTLLTKKEYESEMNILVQNARGSLTITPERTASSPGALAVTEEQVNSELEVLRSKEIASATVDPNWASANHSDSALRAHEKDVEKFRKKLSAELIRKSNVIHITYSASSPQEAQETLKRLLSAFLVKQREIERPAGASQFLAQQADQYKAELEQAQQKFAAYQQQVGVVSLPEKEAALEKQVADLEADLRSTNLELTDVTHRVDANQRQLSALPQRQGTIERSVPYQMSVEQLNTLLAGLQNKREELTTKYVSSDPLVQENAHQIENTKAMLATMGGTHSRETSTDINPVWQQVSSAIAVGQTAIRGLEAKRDRLKSQIQESMTQLDAVESSTVAFSALHRRVTELENDQQLYGQKRDEAQIADAMDEHKLLNVAVAEVPTTSFLPIRPKPLINIALGGFTAFFIACGALFVAEMTRNTVANASELESISEFRVLAVVPKLNSTASDFNIREPKSSGSGSGVQRTPWEESQARYQVGKV